MYGFHTEIPAEFEPVRKQVIETLQKEGFDVLTEIDFADTLKAKLGAQMRPYTILGACDAPLAAQALEADLDSGLLLPCKVMIRQDEPGRQTVAFLDPEATMGLAGNPRLGAVAREARQRLERVRESLTG